MNNGPIGIFDSGMGGLSVWRALHDSLPEESLLYLGDGKNCPYGDRTAEEVRGFSLAAVERLLACGSKLIVVACNTATAMAISMLRSRFPHVPFVGLEPAVKPAAESSRTGIIGVLATSRSFDGELYRATSARYADRVKILEAVGEGFVELVENNLEKTPEARAAVRRIVRPMAEEGADRIVLGCTHYPFLRGAIADAVEGFDVEIMDSSAAIERRVEHLLDEFDLRAVRGHLPQYDFISFADAGYVERLREKAFE